MQIRLENLKRDYGSLHAVDGVSLNIPSNTVYGIIGRSGAGKSTLVRLVSMLERPDEGEVWYGDKRVDNLSKKELIEERRKIGMIFQKTMLSSISWESQMRQDTLLCTMKKPSSTHLGQFTAVQVHPTIHSSGLCAVKTELMMTRIGSRLLISDKIISLYLGLCLIAWVFFYL